MDGSTGHDHRMAVMSVSGVPILAIDCLKGVSSKGKLVGRYVGGHGGVEG